ncbi:MAG: glycosyltransferase [Bacteroidota bacterium]
MNKFVSIIMPVFNGEKFIRFAIESVINQTYRDFEFIIINDASTDNTKSIIEEYIDSDNRIKIITNDENIKIVRSINIGLKHAKGEFIARIDSDDIWEKDKLEQQIKYLSQNPSLHLLGTSKIIIDENGNIMKSNEKKIYNYKDIKKNILKYNLFCHSSVIFKKSLTDSIGYYNEVYKNSEDYEYWIRIITLYESEILPDILVRYRISPQMVSLKNRKQQNRYVIKAKIEAFKLMGFSIKYIPYLVGDFYRICVPDFLIKFKKNLKKSVFTNSKKN